MQDQALTDKDNASQSGNNSLLLSVLTRYRHLLPAKDEQEASSLAAQARLVVKGSAGFVFHVPSGCYVLFVTLPGVLPAFLERFDQAGKEWQLLNTDTKKPSLQWNKATSSVLLSFLSSSTKSGMGTGSVECLCDDNIRIVGCDKDTDDTNDEVETIRRILVDELVKVKHHPSRHFLLPLAQAIHGKRQKWRKCLRVEIRPKLPVVQLPKADRGATTRRRERTRRRRHSGTE